MVRLFLFPLQFVLTWIPANFQKLLAAGLVAGFVFSPLLAPVAAFSDLMVAAIIFNGFLTRSPSQAVWSDGLLQVSTNIALTKILFPLVLFPLTAFLPPEVRMALILLASLPAAGVSPSLIRLLGGDGELGMKILLCESLVSCVTVPLLFQLLFTGNGMVSAGAMALYFTKVLIVPLAAATLVRIAAGPGSVARLAPWGGAISVALIVTLVTAIAAKIGPSLLDDPLLSAGTVLAAFGVVPLYATVSVCAHRSATTAADITFGIKNMYINIGLGLGLAAAYFPAGVALMLLAYVIPANLLPRQIARLARALSKHRPSC
jgi:predicted Na+-dependent transporter